MGHETEMIYANANHPRDLECSECGLLAQYQFSSPTFFMAGDRAPIDTAAEAWSGTCLEGSDGINQSAYRSTKVQVDHGHHDTPPVTKPRDQIDQMLGVSRQG